MNEKRAPMTQGWPPERCSLSPTISRSLWLGLAVQYISLKLAAVWLPYQQHMFSVAPCVYCAGASKQEEQWREKKERKKEGKEKKNPTTMWNKCGREGKRQRWTAKNQRLCVCIAQRESRAQENAVFDSRVTLPRIRQGNCYWCTRGCVLSYVGQRALCVCVCLATLHTKHSAV